MDSVTPMRVAIIGGRRSLNTQDLLQACTSIGASCEVYAIRDVAIDTATFQDSVFMQHDVYIFRGYNRSYQLAQALAQYLVEQGKIVIDSALASGFVPSKLHEALVYSRHDIPHPRTRRVGSFDHSVDQRFPAVVKEVDSQKGDGVSLIDSADALVTKQSLTDGDLILQDYLPMVFDLRVICVGDAVLGAVKRRVVEGDFRSNVSLGSVAEFHSLTDDEHDLALRAHRVLGYDVSGVDIGRSTEGELFVIETNITPEWQGFKQATGIDVGGEIINYAQRRFADAE